MGGKSSKDKDREEKRQSKSVESASQSRVLSSQNAPSTSGERDTEKEDSDIRNFIDKASKALTEFMQPDPILDVATYMYNCPLSSSEIKDVEKQMTTREKNEHILEIVKTKGKTGYTGFKRCLEYTKQTRLFELLEWIENGRGPERIYTTLRIYRELKKDLVDFYRSNHNMIPLSPLIEDDHIPITEFYVSPNINSVHVERAYGGGREYRTPVEALEDVFCDKSKKCNEIYLTADVGLGKTFFCKRLALAWCQAHTPIKDHSKCFSKDEIDALKNFDFLFLLFLRDSKDECDIDEIIKNQIVEQLKRPALSKEEIGKILFSEKRCLVILDGLDEWTHPSKCKRVKSDVPHRKESEWTYLTTSRPWKLSVINIPSKKIDQRLELAGLGRESANTLKRNVISHFSLKKDETILQTRMAAFSEAIEKKDISDLEVIPLLLMYLLCLWCEEKDLGNSRCELYCNILELLLSRTDKKCNDIPSLALHTQGDIPQCFSKHARCRQFYALLTSLAQLAYQTLFNETKENNLVFDNSIAEEYLNEELLNFCLQSGILTRSKIRGKLIKQEVKISFAHITVHEYFAALYIHFTQDKSAVKTKVLSQCNSIKDILEMSKVFIFLSGINVNVLSSISRELINVINEDEITQHYRMMANVTDYEKYIKPLKESQNMYISCVKENPQNADLKLCLQDIFIDKDCRQETYYKQLQQLAVQNKENIRSVSIEMQGIPYSVQEIIDCFELADLRNVDKIYYRGTFDDCDITPLLHSSVKSLSLIPSKWQDYKFIAVDSTWSASVSSRFYSLDNLEAIYIDCFVMSHDQLEQFVELVSKRNFMRKIALWNLHCSEHWESCTGCRLDLSARSQLRSLSLGNIPLSELTIDVTSLELCHVGHLPTPRLTSRLLSHLPSASKLQTFLCSSLESSEDIDKMAATLRQLVSVKHVKLLGINLGGRALPLRYGMVNIELVVMSKVKMWALVFMELVYALQTLPQTVMVKMKGCEITTEEEFQRGKDLIKTSPSFIVTSDGINQFKQYAFEFKTVRDEDYERVHNTAAASQHVRSTVSKLASKRPAQSDVASGQPPAKKRKTEITEVADQSAAASQHVRSTVSKLASKRPAQSDVASGQPPAKKRKTEITEVADQSAAASQHVRSTVSKLASKRPAQSDVASGQPPAKKRKTEITEVADQSEQHLEDDLISFYRSQHSKEAFLSPLIREDTPLMEFHVMPDLKVITVKRAFGERKEEKTPVASFRDIFYNKDKLYSEIYLTAGAGLGKTELCKRLALAWCQARKPLKNETQHFSEEEIGVMNGFRFTFLLLLRDSCSGCDVNDLIFKQIVSRLDRTYALKDLKSIIHKETCLVILDGLDEWTHPPTQCSQRASSTPHRQTRECTTFMTTTKPWKLSVSGLKYSDIDQRLEITELNENSAFALKRSVISHLSGEKDKKKLEQAVKDFSRTVEAKQISDLEANPLILVYSLALWYESRELGGSECELYSNIIEFLLSKTEQTYKDTSSEKEHSQGNIPQCFRTQKRCRQFYPLLTALGQLAFHTLFRETREENALVFDSSLAEKYLNKDLLTFCLNTEIITQSKVQGHSMKQVFKMSFAHKTVHDFFAALYMHSARDQSSVTEIVLRKCKCVKDILEMSKVLKFITGLNVNMSSLISRELMKIINQDKVTWEYRSTSNPYFNRMPLKEYQDMCISSCKELPHENEVSLCLQDVFIDTSCKQEQYRKFLKQVITRNKQNIRSLYIDTCQMRDTSYDSAQKVIDYFELYDLKNTEKIHYEGKYTDRDICLVLNGSVKCLYLSSRERRSSWSLLLYRRVYSLRKLEAISIGNCGMSHRTLEFCFDYISERNNIREIELRQLVCTDHESVCAGFKLDLSEHSHLKRFSAIGIPLSEVQINMCSLEKLNIRNLFFPGLVLNFVDCGPAACRLNALTCSDLKSSAAIDTLLDSLRFFLRVEIVLLVNINLGDREMKLLTEMQSIKHFGLSFVAMSASAFRSLVEQVEQLPQTVEVDIDWCDITPEREFEAVKEKIKTSRHFRMLGEDESSFEFETIK